MSKTAAETAKNRPPEGHLGRGLLGLLVVALLALCLGGAWIPSHFFREGEVAPVSFYAPFDVTAKDQGELVEIKRGELLVTRGQRLTHEQMVRLSALEGTLPGTGTSSRWWGALGLALLFTIMACAYLAYSEPKIWRNTRHLILIALAVGGPLGIGKLMGPSPLDTRWIPIAAVSMLLSALLTPRVGIAFGSMATILAALMVENSLPWVAATSIGCFIGAYGMRRVRRRIHFFQVGILTGLSQALALCAGELLLGTPFWTACGHSIAGAGSGLLSALLVFCLLPLAESAFGLITDVSLVELSDLNHPLLKELSVKAPGTYHHSLIVARLAEAACEEVGANPLLARVGCYFHDIGKMLHPEYFVENQPPKHSRHETLAPSLSSLVILNHVKDGVDLARRCRLNQRIIDFIPGHHGTGLIYYFYRRALEEVEDETLLKEERFRYPGPKPQTKETAIALLADSTEAATRALREKTPARLEEVIRRIVNNKFVDGQLDECDLTLHDLNRIAHSFTGVAGGIYHSRVEYPRAPGDEEDVTLHAG